MAGGALQGFATNLSPRAACYRGNHAEVRALGRSNSLKITGATIYVARLRKRLSKPCSAGMTKIRAAGIRTIVYFDQDQMVRMIKV